MLTLTLLRGLELCLLCGPRPPLGQLDPQVRRTVAVLPLHIPSTSATCCMQALANQAPLGTSPDLAPHLARPRSCWNAGGSLCWSPSGPACHWALGRYPKGSPCTAIFLGKARWLGPGPGRPFVLPVPHSLIVLSPSLLLLHLELRRCLFTVEPSKDKGAWGSSEWEAVSGRAVSQRPHSQGAPSSLEPSPEQRRRLLRNFYTLVATTHFPLGEWWAWIPHSMRTLKQRPHHMPELPLSILLNPGLLLQPVFLQ